MGDRKKIAEDLMKVSEELELAAQHCRIAANRYSQNDIPSGCAHIFALIGHMNNAKQSIDKNAVVHASHAQLTGHD